VNTRRASPSLSTLRLGLLTAALLTTIAIVACGGDADDASQP
tara:strand:- start:7694 stop:7819 length:126 start_codon:yes stop_codon:yes gene_type:complete